MNIYRRLLNEINNLKKIAEEQKLQDERIETLLNLEEHILQEDMKEKKYILGRFTQVFRKRPKEPDNMNIFEIIQDRVNEQKKLMFAELQRKIEIEKFEQNKNQKMLDIVLFINEYCSNPELYLDFEAMANNMDFTQGRIILKEYFRNFKEYKKQLEDICASTDNMVYRSLFISNRKEQASDIIEEHYRSINRLKKAYKWIEQECMDNYKYFLTEYFQNYIYVVLSEEVVRYTNAKIIRKWNYYFGENENMPFIAKDKKIQAYLGWDLKNEQELYPAKIFYGIKEDLEELNSDYFNMIEKKIQEILLDKIKKITVEYLFDVLKELIEKNTEKISEFIFHKEELTKQIIETEELCLKLNMEQSIPIF